MSNTGLTNISVSELAVQNTILAGDDLDTGSLGQVLISGGDTGNVRWGSNSATLPNALTMGSNVSLTSGNSSFNGGIADTINAVDNNTQLNLTGGDGITITNTGGLNRTIETDNDETTISNSTGENKVLKVPNTLTFTGYDTGSFDGSSSLSINLVDTDTTYTAGNGIQISGSNRIQTKTDNQTIRDSGGGSGNNLEVIKVPNSLSFTGYTTGSFDGSSSLSINLVDTDTTYQGGTGISIDTATNPDTINCSNIPNSALTNSTISGISLGSNLANLTFYNSSGGFITSYNGANPPTSITLDGDTTYQGGSNISIDTSTNPDTINLDGNITGITDFTFASAPITTTLKGNDYPLSKTTCSYLDLSSSTNVFPNFDSVNGFYRDTTTTPNLLYKFVLPNEFLNDNDASGYARSVIADTSNHGAQQCYGGSQYYAFFNIPAGYYFSGFRVNLVNSVGTPQGSTPTGSFYVNIYKKTINSNLTTVGTTKGFNTNNTGYTIESGYGSNWDINDPITICAIQCYRNPWSSAFYNRGGWIQFTEGTPPSGGGK